METVNIVTFIIDDDPETLGIIKETIEKAGITNYKLFFHEEEFINELTEKIHVCVIDHRLSKFTGLDILKSVKAKNEYSFVIIYTGFKDPEIIIDYLNQGADRFIDKGRPNHLELLTSYLLEGYKIATNRINFQMFIKSEKEKHYV